MFQNQKHGCMIMEIINWIKDFLGNVEFDLVVNLSDIITVIVFLFTIAFNIYSLNKEKKRFRISLIEQHQQFQTSLDEQREQFEQQMELQIKQYEDNRTLDLKKNQFECLPIILLEENIQIEETDDKHLIFKLKITNRGNGLAYACHPQTIKGLCLHIDENEEGLEYFQTDPGVEVLNIKESFNFSICSSKIPNNTPKEVYFKIEYYDLMGRKYHQLYRFFYNYPKKSEATRIGTYLWECVQDIDNNYKNFR